MSPPSFGLSGRSPIDRVEATFFFTKKQMVRQVNMSGAAINWIHVRNRYYETNDGTVYYNASKWPTQNYVHSSGEKVVLQGTSPGELHRMMVGFMRDYVVEIVGDQLG